jgi:hypothetical protein
MPKTSERDGAGESGGGGKEKKGQAAEPTLEPPGNAVPSQSHPPERPVKSSAA